MLAFGTLTPDSDPAITSSPLEYYQYDPKALLSDGEAPPCHPWLQDVQAKVIRGQVVQKGLMQLQEKGLAPDLVIGHTGWGELMGLRAILPKTPILGYPEYFFHWQGADCNFDPEFQYLHPDSASEQALRRALQLLDLSEIDWGLAPTWWQWSLMPQAYRQRFSVIHEGIDCERIAPKPNASVQLEKSGLHFQAGDELVTYISRDLEPHRGFLTFMRSLPLLLRRRPQAHVLIVGGTGPGYSTAPPPDFDSWKDFLLHHMGPLLDASRVHFLPKLPHPVLHEVLRVSAAHVYLTVPFVLSWSLLEAMACAAPIVASNTEPVRELIRDGIEARLVNMLDPQELARVIIEVLENPEKHRQMGANARRHVQQHYDLHRVCLPQQLELVETLLQGIEPAPPQPPPGIERALFQPPPPRLKPRP
ncbi:MAG: glycosyltransferase [Prochlorococcaceae cyanobacterium]